MTLLYIFIACFAVVLTSQVGALTYWRRAADFVETRLSDLTSFSAGVFLAITIFLIIEAYEHVGSLSAVTLYILGGVALVFGVFKLLPEFHHHHDVEEGGHSHSHSRRASYRVLASDALHHVADGILITATFLSSVSLGVFTAIGVFVHELVQEVSKFFILKRDGFTVKRTLQLSFLVASTVFIGAIGAYLIEDLQDFDGPILAIAAGFFLVLIVQDLIPHSLKSARKEAAFTRHILWAVAGFLLMVATGMAFGHVHA